MLPSTAGLATRLAHHSGPGRLAKPYPVEDFHLLFFRQRNWRTQLRVKSNDVVCFTDNELTAMGVSGAGDTVTASEPPTLARRCWRRALSAPLLPETGGGQAVPCSGVSGR